ncbi:hypothetical protein LNKW23_40230 [Paralimibaculum aggregatum]|uniref:Uncharacterized protein n=2 Tax=Paralimibaculum aggregatum TaxID=3036245 RepID=A0ABQ6LP77_9RHOB|nr:hypothetical protein LNKW23_40230 [Limibaculum sp. NKW23]
MPYDMNRDSLLEEQGKRAQKLFAAVVLAAIDDAILEEKKSGTGVSTIASWARSKDGKLILSAAGIEVCERTVENLMAFVARGIKTTVA